MEPKIEFQDSSILEGEACLIADKNDNVEWYSIIVKPNEMAYEIVFTADELRKMLEIAEEWA